MATWQKTVGGYKRRYRLGHFWVPEMVLNVQSELGKGQSKAHDKIYFQGLF